MRINNRFIYGIISILLAAVIAFVAIPVVTKKTSSTLEIVRVVNHRTGTADYCPGPGAD